MKNIKSGFNINKATKTKYYIKYKKHNPEQFIEFNGKHILKKRKKNDFIVGKIYCIYSFEKSNALTISNETDMHEYITEHNINDFDIPFSFNGKLMDINDNIYVILSDDIEQVIFLKDEKNIIKILRLMNFIYFMQ